MKNVGRVTFLAIVTALLFALQHPLSKPLIDQIGRDLVGLAKVALLSSILTLTATVLIALTYDRKLRNEYLDVLGNIGRYKILFVTALATVATLALYIYGMSRFHPGTVALLLNTGPIWSAILGYYFRDWLPPRFFFPCVIIALLAIGYAIWSSQSTSVEFFAADLAQAAIVLLVPFLFVLGYSLRERYMPGIGASVGVFASATLAMPLAILLAVGIVISQDGTFSYDFTDTVALTFFVLGTLSLSLVGSVLYQVAVNESGGDTAYIALFHLLIPGLTGIYGEVLHAIWPRYALQPNTGQIIAMIVIVFALAVVVAQKSPQALSIWSKIKKRVGIRN